MIRLCARLHVLGGFDVLSFVDFAPFAIFYLFAVIVKCGDGFMRFLGGRSCRSIPGEDGSARLVFAICCDLFSVFLFFSALI